MRSLRPYLPARTAAPLCLLLATLTLTACGSSSSSSSSGSSSGAGANTAETGKQIFENVGCAGCHTLAAADSHGNIGPNLDKLKPSYAAVYDQVRNGGGGMPSFKSELSSAQIASVAHYVASVTGGGG